MSERVEIYHPTLGWGTVCQLFLNIRYQLLTITEASVICRQLGFSGANTIRYGNYYGKGSGPVLLSNIKCSGNESFIWDCSHNGWNNPLPLCNHDYDLGVDCYWDHNDSINGTGLDNRVE